MYSPMGNIDQPNVTRQAKPYGKNVPVRIAQAAAAAGTATIGRLEA